MSEKGLIITAAPHLRDRVATPRIMQVVFIALMPAALCEVYFFGPWAAINLVVGVASAVLWEYAIQKIWKFDITISDGSAALTGLLVALTLPPAVEPWVTALACLIAIGPGKIVFGGLGYNIFNPALIGRTFAALSWPSVLSAGYVAADGITAWKRGFDVVASATPLGLLKTGEIGATSLSRFYGPLFFGNVGGSLGETSAIALLIGALFLLFAGIITLRIPLVYLLTTAGLAMLFNQDPIFHLLSGGLILGAFFMATDYVTSPIKPAGQIVYAVGLGIFTFMIRMFGSYPEGVAFSILLMNCFVPLIERFGAQKRFGEVRNRA